jgi:UDP-N-acetylglucosamine--N-acetylmuramyl-(pentapeptide) pyrophosphoryl-undecaprenol N-acetylglucosamine transferase
MNTHTKNKVALCAGGTGGHLFPLIVIAEQLSQHKITPILITDKRGASLHPQLQHLNHFIINAGGFVGRNIFQKIIATCKLALGFFQALIILKNENPDVVVGFGAHTSLPACFAALFLKIPVVIHEQNAILGRANRLFSPYASIIATSFNETHGIPENLQHKIQCSGNPVRTDIITSRNIPYSLPLEDSQPLNILIFGGSQGASVMDTKVIHAIGQLPPECRKRLKITHQARKNDLEIVKKAYLNIDIQPEIAPFFNDLPQRLAQNHLIISRAGATTIAEITTVGRPAILIPFQFAVDNHQNLNATRLVENNAAWLIEEDNFDVYAFTQRLHQIILHTHLLSETAARAHALGFPEAADKMLHVITSLIPNHQPS